MCEPSLLSSQFRVSPGYAKKDSVVIGPILAEGRYLRVEGSAEVVIATQSGVSSAFIQRKRLSDSAGVSFESVDLPGYCLRTADSALLLAKVGPGDKAPATFYTVGRVPSRQQALPRECTAPASAAASAPVPPVSDRWGAVHVPRRHRLPTRLPPAVGGLARVAAVPGNHEMPSQRGPRNFRGGYLTQNSVSANN